MQTVYDLPALIPQEDSKEKVPPAAAPARCPGDVSASKGEPSDGAYTPLKDLHPKDIVPPTPYEGDSASWLDWSARFRNYAVSCSDRRLVQLLERIELLRGNPVTAADEANWEQELRSRSAFTQSLRRVQPVRRAWSSRNAVRIACATLGASSPTRAALCARTKFRSSFPRSWTRGSTSHPRSCRGT